MVRQSTTNIRAGFKQWIKMVDHCVCRVGEWWTQRTRTVCGMRDFVRTDAKNIIRFESFKYC